jgi:hypothetical protein
MCQGGSSFNQLRYLRDTLRINDGLVLNDGYISYSWLNILFWRTFIALFLHLLSILILQAMSLKLGFFKNEAIILQIEDITERPGEDAITAYAFIKQPFFHKAFAINQH